MILSTLVDRIDQLPLPLAQLVVRTQNAKSAADRHYLAWSLAEATLKLCASARIAIWVRAGPRPGEVASLLPHIARPKTGGWVAMVRAVDADLGRRPDAKSLPLGRLHGRLEIEQRWSAVEALTDAALAEGVVSDAEARDARARGLAGFFGLVPAYRKNTLKIGQPPNAFCERFSKLWLAAVDEVLASCEPWDDAYLVARMATGWLDLRGLGTLPVVASIRAAETVAVGEVALRADDVAVSLMPLAVYADEEDGLGENVLLLNGATIKSRSKGNERTNPVRSVEYLNYVSGESSKIDTRAQMDALLVSIQAASLSARKLGEIDGGPASGGAIHDDSPADAGALVGDYEIIDELGRGGMGVVYRARQMSTRRVVALKVLPPVLADDPESVARFEREVRALGRCDHPNVIKVYAAHLRSESPYYAMEFVDGADLAGVAKVLSTWRTSGGRLRGGHVTSAAKTARSRRSADSSGAAGLTAVGATAPPAEEDTSPPSELLSSRSGNFYRDVARLFAGAAGGLAELHRHGVLHRDVKPGNLMLTAEGERLVVMDLGLAWLADATRQLTMTQSGGLGTLRYMPPEQLDRNLLGAEGKLDARADVYGLGASLYEFAVGKPMLSGGTDSDISRQVLEEKPVAPSKRDAQLPKALSDIIEVATSKRADDRYASAAEFAKDLRRFAEHGTSAARPKTRVQRALRWARQRPLRVAAVVAGVVGLVFAADYGGAYALGDTKYCAAMAWRWGVPECVGEVSESVAAHRLSTFRFEYLRGRVSRVAQVDAVGGMGVDVFITQWVPRYNDDGVVEYVDSLNRNSIRAQRQSYQVIDERHWSVQFLDRGLRPQRQRGLNAKTQSAAVVGAHWTFNRDGHVERVRWVNVDGHSHPNDGVYGERYELNADGLVSVREFLGPDGETRQAMRGGVAFFRNEYDARGEGIATAGFNQDGSPSYGHGKAHRGETLRDEYGNPVEYRNYDGEDRLMVGDDGYAFGKWSYVTGKLVETTFFGADNEPVFSETYGASRITATHDAEGNVLAGEYFGTDQQRVLGKDGCARIERTYNERGDWISRRCLGVALESQPDADGCVGRKWTRDDRTGEVLRDDCSDARDAPSLRKDLCAAIVSEFTGDGDLRSRECRGVADEPWLDNNGRWRTDYRHNGRGYFERMTYLGLDQKPITDSKGVAAYVYSYDADGNLESVAHLGSEGQAVSNEEGYAGYKNRWNPDGTRSEFVPYGLDGKPTVDRTTGAAIQRWEYDDRGNWIARSFFDEQGQPILTPSGATIRRRLDERDNVIGWESRGLKNELVANNWGYARLKRVWDTRGNNTEEIYFRADGERTFNSTGYSKSITEFDARGRKIAIRYLGTHDEPVITERRAHRQEDDWDDRGKLLARRFFGTDGKPTSSAKGYASFSKTYDGRGHLIEESYFDKDGKLVVLPAGWASRKGTYNARGKVTEVRYFGISGPTLRNNGTFLTTYSWDTAGNDVETAFFGADEKPILNRKGFHRAKSVFDERHKRIAWAAFAIDGKPVRYEGGDGAYTAAYDRFGHQITTAYHALARPLDEATALDPPRGATEVQRASVRVAVHEPDVERSRAVPDLCTRASSGPHPTHFDYVWEPVTDKRGIARVEREYDSRGNLLTEAHCGLNGERAPDEHGVSVTVKTYDQRDKAITVRYFGSDGEPTPNKDGYAGGDFEWNARGRPTRHATLGVDGRPVVAFSGYAVMRSWYDNQDFKIEEAYFDTDGKTPSADHDGVARVRFSHNSVGKITQQSYFGIDDAPIITRYGYAILRAEYNARGKTIAQSFFGLDDQPVAHSQGMHRFELTYDERGNVMKRAYFDTSGGPFVHPKRGYACATFTFDESDKQTSEEPCRNERPDSGEK